MATNFPTTLDTFTNPDSSSRQSVLTHSQQHANVNDCIAVLEAKVGIDGSAVVTTLDYRINALETSILALGTIASQNSNNVSITGGAISGVTLSATNANLTSPNLNTPSAIVLTNGSGLPLAGLSNLHANLVTPLQSAPTGTGVVVLATSPVLTTPSLGVATATSLDCPLLVPTGNLIEQRNGTAAQGFRLYNTYTNASNNEYVRFLWSGNQLYVTSQKTGSGSYRDINFGSEGAIDLRFWVASATRWYVAGSGSTFHFLPFVTNTYDIGGTSNTVRTGYFGTSLIVPKLQGGGVTDSFGMIDWSGTTGRSSLAGGGGRAPWECAALTATSVALKAGTSTGNIAKVGGTFFDHYADVSSTSTDGTENDLYTDTIPANVLGANGDKIIASEYFSFVASATAARQVKKYFAGTLVWDSGALTLTLGGEFRLVTEIIRESSTIVRITVSVTSTSASSIPYATYTRITGLTLSSTNILKSTGISSGAGAASGDIIEKMMAGIDWKAAA